MGKEINLIEFIKKINNDLSTKDINEEALESNDVSELHMHKMLFILYGAFHKKFNKELFEPNFQAWTYGPVEIDYRTYKKQDDMSKLEKFNFTFSTQDEKIFLKKLIIKLLKFSPWSLVDYTHSMSAWFENYDEDEAEHINKISKEEIFKSFEDKDFIV